MTQEQIDKFIKLGYELVNSNWLVKTLKKNKLTICTYEYKKEHSYFVQTLQYIFKQSQIDDLQECYSRLKEDIKEVMK